MTAVAILEEAKQLGIVLEAQGNHLRFRAPKGTLTPELREALARHKGEILAVLQSRQPATGYGLCPGPQKCAGCYAIPGGRYMHPPKPTQDWLDWLAKWQPKEGNAIQ